MNGSGLPPFIPARYTPPMLFLRAFVFLALCATPALALSCMPYFAEQAFLDAQASSDRYVIVHGRLDFNPADLPTTDMLNQERAQPDNLFGATLTGFSLTGAGYNNRFVRQIRVNAQCFGPWCSSLEAGADYLAFLKQEPGGYLLEISPCGGMAFANPPERVLQSIHECLLGGRCEPPIPER